jgi:cyclopropane fatty-acyl-phospholipid synthase-like methyltransferase
VISTDGTTNLTEPAARTDATTTPPRVEHDAAQLAQELEYEFPYHHLVEIRPFSLGRYLFWGQAYAAYLELVMDELAQRPFQSVIDIGCGDGKLVLEMSKRFPGRRVVGTDYSSRALAFARAFAPGLEFHETTPDETFDAFTLIEVLEHIPPEQIDAFLTDIKSHLRPGGIGIVTVPSTARPVQRKHYQHFDEQTLRAALSPHFEVQSVRYLNRPCKWLQKLLANDWYVLNWRPLRDRLYRRYKRRYLHATSKDGLRLMAVVTKPK